MTRSGFRAFVFLLCISVAVGQRNSAPPSYEVDEAYRVYEAILPNEESYSFAKGKLVIQLEPDFVGGGTRGCLSDEATRKFKAATTDFTLVNSKGWALQSKFQLAKPYGLVPSETIHAYFKERGPAGWKDFYQEHPGSGGFITLSAGGFNKAKTLAVVHAGSSCGELCGSWRFHLLQKIGGKWKESSGVSCVVAS